MKFPSLFLILLVFLISAEAQNKPVQTPVNPKLNWYNKDYTQDHVLGISTERAYNELLKNRKWVPVIVAVIDGGVDSNHEDLKSVLWKNSKEISGNGKDDDHNGYADDIHGWNFIGGADGKDVSHDTFESTRILALLDPIYLNKSRANLSAEEQKKYDLYLKVKKDYQKEKYQSQYEINSFQPYYEILDYYNSLLKRSFKVKSIDTAFLKTAQSRDESIKQGIYLSGQLLKMGYPNLDSGLIGIKNIIIPYQDKIKYGLDTSFNTRKVVGDHYTDWKEKYYGNPDFMGPDALHGTHVSGIIGAVRNNGKGINGVANHVIIMPIRAVPDGDERDKDIANSILYAVDNGAKIINMSFGKGFSPYKEAVDAAVQYAESKGVLLVHSAGNEGADKDTVIGYPNREYLSGGIAQNWIEVGASSSDTGKSMAADFSNFGKKTVDVFAPGVDIYSTVPIGNQYKLESGTSMAGPVVSGMAAVLKSYFPYLKPQQIREIIMKSVVQYHNQVIRPGSKDVLVPFDSLSISGGIVNLYRAVKLALTYPEK